MAELQGKLAKVVVQLATAPESAELLEQQAALEAELKAAKAKKSADSAAAGAYGLFKAFPRAPPCSFAKSLRSTPPSPCISHTHS